MDKNEYNEWLHRKMDAQFPVFANFRKSLKRYQKYGLSEEDCINGIRTACAFFGMPMPQLIEDMTNNPNGQTMFVNRNRGSYLDDVLCYDLEELKRLGADSLYSYSLIMTHECGHRLMQNTAIPGANNGQWEHELVADFFMGVRAAVDHFPNSAVEAVKKGLGGLQGAVTHPTGFLRIQIINYGFKIGSFDMLNNTKHPITYYLERFEEWRQANLNIIRLHQFPFLK